MQQPIPESPSQPLNIHGITLKGKHDENWGQLFTPMIDQWNNRHAFRVDAYPRQEGLLSFNSDYMVWYRRKTKMFVDPTKCKHSYIGSSHRYFCKQTFVRWYCGNTSSFFMADYDPFTVISWPNSNT
ncbi:hypothetical protein GmHk_08G023500 [Glycine max]|nr:hypothetical protein GmHk_08G023500 [Glycine max]